MPYSRYRRRSGRVSRRIRRKPGRITRKVRRTSRRTRRSGVSRRRLLNITSEKKSSARLIFGVSAGASAGTFNNVLVSGTRASLFCPTGQYPTFNKTEQDRTSQLVYARGYSEKIRISCGTSHQWAWRRIVFTFKGNIYGSDTGFGIDSDTVHRGTNNGATVYGRVFNELNGNAYVNIRDLLYKGKEGIDWFEQRTAPIDTSRISLVRDTTMVLKSLNDDAHVHLMKMWYPLNKNLMYDDDAKGEDEKEGSAYSVRSKPGMGDLYIYDVFFPEFGLDSTSPAMSLNMEGRYYWHER